MDHWAGIDTRCTTATPSSVEYQQTNNQLGRHISPMNLNIDRFVTRCQDPKRSATAWQGLDRVVRERFPQECRREISARVPESTRVIRIRRLLIRLQLSGQFDSERLLRRRSAP